MRGAIVNFTDKNDEKRIGQIVHEYGAFEGGIRYVIRDETNGRDYRCVRKNNDYKELVI